MFNNQELNKEKEYSTSKIDKVIPLSAHGLDESWYGGNAKFLAELKNEPLILVVSNDLQTIDVGVEKNRIQYLAVKYINELIKQGKIKSQVENKHDTSREKRV